MKINKEELYKLYIEEVNHIAEECDWVTHLGPKEIVNIIANILQDNPHLVDRQNKFIANILQDSSHLVDHQNK